MNEPSIKQNTEGNGERATSEAQQKGLVDAEGLRAELFKNGCRPSLAWVRRQTRARAIPAVKIGRLVFYDVPAVREKLNAKNVIRPI